MIENMLNYSHESSDQHLDTIIFELDTLDHYDDFDGNSGAKKRAMMLQNGEEVELIGRLHLDMFNTPKLLMNGVDFMLTIELNKPEFYLLKKNAANPSELKIVDCNLYMEHVKLLPDVTLAIEKNLETKMAMYPYKRVDIRTMTIASNSSSFSFDNIYSGQNLPELIIFAMVNNDAYNGDYKLNPFNFQPFNLSEITASVDGYEISPRNLRFNFDLKNPQTQRAYFQLFKQLSFHRFDRANLISRELFNKNCFLIGWDLSPDKSSSDCTSIMSGGNIRLQGKFSKPLAKTVTVLAYMQFDADLGIDKGRNVYTQIV